MIRRILVPLDGWPDSFRVLPRIVPLASRTYAEVDLLRVLPEPGPAKGTWNRKAEVDAARQFLDRAVDWMSGQGIQVHGTLRSGEPSAEILRHALHFRPTLIAMAAHPRRGFAAFLGGGGGGALSGEVLRESPCPVLLFNPVALSLPAPDRPPYRRILVPLDGLPHSERVLPAAMDLAGIDEPEILLLHVEPSIPMTAPAASGDAMPAHPEHVRHHLDAWRRRIARNRIGARILLAGGRPAGEILNAAWREKADLIAMGTHGRSGFDRWMHGSVGEEVLRGAACPVLLWRITAPIVPRRASPGVAVERYHWSIPWRSRLSVS